jgi:L-methionine (R)-S-oxide reductase
LFTFEKAAGDKQTRLNSIVNQVVHLIDGERDWLANLSNTASHLYHTLGEVNWVGFYLMKGNELVLGPFHGLPACIRIPVGKGVCGTAVQEAKTLLVEDVHAFPGHIACDAATRSEMVIPLKVDGQIIGVLDIDSPVISRFDDTDRTALERVAELLCQGCDWSSLLK